MTITISKRTAELVAMMNFPFDAVSLAHLPDEIILEMVEDGLVEDNGENLKQNWSAIRFGNDLAFGRMNIEIEG